MEYAIRSLESNESISKPPRGSLVFETHADLHISLPEPHMVDDPSMFLPYWHHTLPTGSLSARPRVLFPSTTARMRPKFREVSDQSEGSFTEVRDSAHTFPGRALLEQLEAAKAPWAIVTSGTRPLVSGWLDVMKLAHPQFLVTAEEVQQGKPDPACYRLGAQRLGVKSNEALVLEDAPAGVTAGKAAGYRVIALATTHSIDRLRAAGADWVVRDMESVTLSRFDGKTGKISIQVKNSLVA